LVWAGESNVFHRVANIDSEFFFSFFRSVLVVLGIVSDSQVPSQPQTSQTQTGETSNSDKDTMTEKSKESSTAS